MGCRQHPGAACQPAAFSLVAGRVNPGDEGIGGYSTGNTLLDLY